MADTTQKERTYLIDRDDIEDFTTEDMKSMMNEVNSPVVTPPEDTPHYPDEPDQDL